LNCDKYKNWDCSGEANNTRTASAEMGANLQGVCKTGTEKRQLIDKKLRSEPSIK